MESATQTPDLTTCPSCGALTPVHTGYTTWCSQCNWNLQPQSKPAPRTLFDRLYDRLGKKYSRSLYQQMVGAQVLRPSLTFSKFLTYVLASVVHVITFCFAVLGIYLIVSAWPRAYGFFWGGLCLAAAWMLRPRMDQQIPHPYLTREQTPMLYAVMDHLAETMNTRKVHGLIALTDYNAWYTEVGWRRRKVVGFGVPLFTALTPEEQVAVLAHEMAHGANGDAKRTWFVASALRALGNWYYLLRPEQLWPEGSGLVGLLTVVANALRYAVAGLCYGMHYLLCQLLFYNSQRAEYLADAMAAEACGTDAMLSSFEKLPLSNHFYLTLRRVVLTKKRGVLFDEFRNQLDSVPEQERERIRRLELLEDSRLDATHPPTPYRIGFLKAHHNATPKVRLTAAEAEQLAKELAGLQKAAEQKLFDTQRDWMY